MGEKIIVGPINKGLRTDREPFIIDNDSFPTLINAYQWRGRIKRKRGTSQLGRLNKFIGNTDGSGAATIVLNVSQNPEYFQTGVNQFVIGTDIFTDQGNPSFPGMPIVLVTNGSGSGTISQVTSGGITTTTLTITGSKLSTPIFWYPGLPVMGIEDLVLNADIFPGTLAFDTDYSYEILTSNPYPIIDVSYYKNPPDGTYTGYMAKTTWTPLQWNGTDYQQFWTVNYAGALWATNGNPGMQFNTITTVNNITTGPPALADITFANPHNLVVGDFLFINEVATTTGINFQTGYVTVVVSATKVTVEFPDATIASNGTGGIAQYLTNQRTGSELDGIRWFDGGAVTTRGGVPSSPMGWVNFAPPLSNAAFSIDGRSSAQYYLVGAKMIYPMRGYLIFFGVYIQTSTGSPIYLQDTIIFSQNGSPYYTASFTGSESLPTTVFNPILVPNTQGATANAYFEDISGFGGYISSGVAQPILTLNPNEDVLILGYTNAFTRLIFTGNNLIPFLFYRINTELGAFSTFGSITFDRGALTIGNFGIAMTTQVSSQRIDLEIPDQAFEISLTDNGPARIAAGRDFINEWAYITYPSNSSPWNFNNQTLLYNYRDQSWAIFNECYTTYGTFRKNTGFTWATVGNVFASWAAWDEPWNSGSGTLEAPDVLAGNQQGFIMIRTNATSEADSAFIQNITVTGSYPNQVTTVNSPNHCLNNGDYIVINNAQGTIATLVNGLIFSVMIDIDDPNNFTLNPSVAAGSYTYLGGATFQRMYVPLIQTKQFPVSWAMAKKTRIGPQMYLFTTTALGQITLQIYLSTNSSNPSNNGSIVPTQNPEPQNNSLIYSTLLYTCPESTNLGLTPANTNLQQLDAAQQSQIWHRMNTSLIGDTVQLGFTLSDAQMRDPVIENIQYAEIELHGIVLDVTPSGYLA